MIQTYVFLDIETTGLAEVNYGLPKITEISLIAVSIKHFYECSPGSIPRVKNKLTKCFHPQRFIAPVSERITGLSNEMLEEQGTFNAEACELIKNFLNCLPQPICLLAHNGYRHDFALLQAQTKIHGKPLPEDVLCSDTLHAFRQLEVLHKPLSDPSRFPPGIVEPYLSQLEEQDLWMEQSSSEIKNLMDRLEKDHECQVEAELITQQEELDKEAVLMDMLVEESPITIAEREFLTGFCQDLLEEERLELEEKAKKREEEELVTKKNAMKYFNKVVGKPQQNTGDKQLNVDEIHGHTPNKLTLEPWSPVKIATPKRKDNSPHSPSKCPPNVRRQLFPSPIKLTKISDIKPFSYKLPKVYEHLFNKKIPDAHSAEGDSYALLECITAIGPSFHQWVRKNHIKLSAIRKAW